jgi:hypothetical protein
MVEFQGCSGCKNAIFNERWGEYKCKVKQRTCTYNELLLGCVNWAKKEEEKKK